MDFVVHVLEEIFELESEDAERVMLEIHREGAGACGASRVRRRKCALRRSWSSPANINIRFDAAFWNDELKKAPDWSGAFFILSIWRFA